ncbi:hypothetical protein Tco_0490112 [Tanacetum coccineum]
MAFLFLGPNRLASLRVNGYLVKASSNPFTFYDSPLPGVNTPWDVMRIVNHFAAAVFVAVSILKVLKTEDLSRKLEVNYVKFQFRGGLLGMEKYDTVSTPMTTTKLDADLHGTLVDQTKYHCMIGGLMYLTASRPDIAFTTFDSGFELIAYADADHTGCNDDCKSTSGGIQFLGDKLVSWSLKKQDCTAMSSAEAEYVSLSACLQFPYLAIPYNIQEPIRYHFIKEPVEKGTIELYFVGTKYQLADLFTKALPKERFEFLVHKIDDLHGDEVIVIWHLVSNKSRVQRLMKERTTTSSPQASQPSKTKDKGKAIMIKPEVPLKKKDQVALDEEMARNLEAQLQAELIEEERLARKKEEEANIALIESWENTQAMMEADRLLAERLQTREQEELTDEDKAKLFMEFMKKRRNIFAGIKSTKKRLKKSVEIRMKAVLKRQKLHKIVVHESRDKLESEVKKQKTDENEEVEVDNKLAVYAYGGQTAGTKVYAAGLQLLEELLLSEG